MSFLSRVALQVTQRDARRRRAGREAPVLRRREIEDVGTREREKLAVRLKFGHRRGYGTRVVGATTLAGVAAEHALALHRGHPFG